MQISNQQLPQLEDLANIGRDWLQNHALPLWSTQGIDKQNGGFCELTDFDGIGDCTTNKRILVQGRQSYVYSHAHALGIFEGLDYAQQSIDFIIEHGFNNDGWVHLLSAQGETIDNTQDAYDYAFILLALGWYQSQKKDTTSQAYIHKTLASLDEQFKTQQGYHESIPATSARLPRRQNPHMHLFEAMLALYELTGEQHYLTRADAIFELFELFFYDKHYRVIREFFDECWQPYGDQYNQIEPGHMMEWVWLLRQYQRLKPTAKVDSYCDVLFDNAITLGFDKQHGVLCDIVMPTGEIYTSSRRCWPQTECIKAALVQHHIHGENRYAEIAKHSLLTLFSDYFQQCPSGGWRDTFDKNMQNVSTTMPASTLYHVFVALQQLLHYHNSSHSDTHSQKWQKT